MTEYKCYKYETCEYCEGTGAKTYIVQNIASKSPCGYCTRGKIRSEVSLESAMLEVMRKSFKLAAFLNKSESN